MRIMRLERQAKSWRSAFAFSVPVVGWGMIFGGFLKGSAPWTRRQNINLGVCCAAMVAVTGAVIGLDQWGEASVTRHVDGGGATVVLVDAAVFRCSPQYFFGRDVLLDRPDGVRVWRRVCLDWTGLRWFSFPIGEEPPDHYFIAKRRAHAGATTQA